MFRFASPCNLTVFEILFKKQWNPVGKSYQLLGRLLFLKIFYDHVWPICIRFSHCGDGKFHTPQYGLSIRICDVIQVVFVICIQVFNTIVFEQTRQWIYCPRLSSLMILFSARTANTDTQFHQIIIIKRWIKGPLQGRWNLLHRDKFLDSLSPLPVSTSLVWFPHTLLSASIYLNHNSFVSILTLYNLRFLS